MDDTSSDELDNNIERLAKWIKQANRVLVFAGAGISTESGIPTFYGQDGLVNYITDNQDVNKSDIRIDVIKKFYSENSLPLNEIEANTSHIALNNIFSKGYIHKIITVNKDGLLHSVGMSDENIIEFHGSFTKFVCEQCDFSKRFKLSELAEVYSLYDLINSYNNKSHTFGLCDSCKTPLLSTAINFNHPFSKELVDEALEEAIACDLIISIGSSLKIMPIASIINIAAIKGKTKFIIIDLAKTDLDHFAGMILNENSSIVLEKLSDVLSK